MNEFETIINSVVKILVEWFDRFVIGKYKDKRL